MIIFWKIRMRRLERFIDWDDFQKIRHVRSQSSNRCITQRRILVRIPITISDYGIRLVNDQLHKTQRRILIRIPITISDYRIGLVSDQFDYAEREDINLTDNHIQMNGNLEEIHVKENIYGKSSFN